MKKQAIASPAAPARAIHGPAAAPGDPGRRAQARRGPASRSTARSAARSGSSRSPATPGGRGDTAADRAGEQHERPAVAARRSTTTPTAASVEHDNGDRQRAPRQHERLEEVHGQAPDGTRAGEEHVHAFEIVARLRRNGPPVGGRVRRTRSPAASPSSSTPAVKVTALPMIAAAAARPARSAMTTISSGSVSHAVCVRRPIARPAANAASTISRPVAASSASVTRRGCASLAAARTPPPASPGLRAPRPGRARRSAAGSTVTSASGQRDRQDAGGDAVSASPLTARASGCIATIRHAPAIIASSESAAVSTGTAVQRRRHQPAESRRARAPCRRRSCLPRSAPDSRADAAGAGRRRSPARRA